MGEKILFLKLVAHQTLHCLGKQILSFTAKLSCGHLMMAFLLYYFLLDDAACVILQTSRCGREAHVIVVSSIAIKIYHIKSDDNLTRSVQHLAVYMNKVADLS